MVQLLLIMVASQESFHISGQVAYTAFNISKPTLYKSYSIVLVSYLALKLGDLASKLGDLVIELALQLSYLVIELALQLSHLVIELVLEFGYCGISMRINGSIIFINNINSFQIIKLKNFILIYILNRNIFFHICKKNNGFLCCYLR